MTLTARALARRLAAALMLVAVLTLGLHEAANSQAASQGGAPPSALASLQPGAALDHDEADRGPAKHLGAVQDAFRVCAVAAPLPRVAVAAPPPAAAFGAPASVAVPPGLDPGGPRHPPRGPAIA